LAILAKGGVKYSVDCAVHYWWTRAADKKRKIMDDDNVSKPSAFFQIKDLYQQAEDLGLRTKVPAQRKLTSTNQGLGLRLSTGTQEPTKKLKKSVVKSSPTVVKHTFASLRKHMQEIKGGLSSSTTLEVVDEDESRTKENKDPATKENEMLTPPSVIDLLTQVENREIDDEESTATIFVGTGGWTTRPDPWTRVFQARSTEGGMDFYVDQQALGEVAGSLLRDLTHQKSAAEKCGREY
jgi:hypothetical protein